MATATATSQSTADSDDPSPSLKAALRKLVLAAGLFGLVYLVSKWNRSDSSQTRQRDA